MKTFVLDRKDDESGVSGTGIVAEGVLFESGKVSISFLPGSAKGRTTPSVIVYDNIEDAEFVHGHGGKTKLVFMDICQIPKRTDSFKM